MGLAEGCALRRDIPRDQTLRFGDVILPPGRLADRLWREQMTRFFPHHMAYTEEIPA
jgi:predicted homoserine dehydrogenase-like protein